MNNIFEPTLFLLNGKEMVKFYTMERPRSVYPINIRIQYSYSERMKEFLASVVEYPMCEWSKELLKKEMFDKIFFGKWTYEKISEQINSTGIRIDDLADRLEVVDVVSDPKRHPLKKEKQIRLRPEVKKKSQSLYTYTDMINAARYGYDYHKTSQFPNNAFDDEAINNFKQYLTTVKPNNP